ncbi:MAG: leucine-rich repeat domain-containing protein, partial [Clostridia bacterium]|nr:leucine-rich repeat domain-containing protein [Clostridia bacterium]
MNKAFKILSLSFVLLLGTVFFAFGTSAANENGILYSVSGGEATVTGVDETVTGDVVIPAELGGYPVTAIGNEAFESNYNITSIIIPEGVETIGERCFYWCDWLEKIRFPATLESVGEWAFYRSYIRELHIPDIASYSQIEYENAFSHPFCYDDEDGFEYWGEEYEKKLYIGDSAETVTDIVIPEGIERIGAYAFNNNSFLKSVVLPDTLTEIGEEAFYECENLESVSFGDSLEHIYEGAFEACESLGNFTLPDSLLTIGEWAFSGNYAMTEVTIPDKVREIHLGTFSYCEALAEVNIGSGVEVIGQEAFENIAATEFIIPDNVKSLGNHLFYGSEKLETVVIGDGLTQAGDWMFNECYNLKNVTLGDGLTELSDKFFKIYDHVDDTKDKWIKLERLDTGDGITALPTEVLDKNTLKEIVIGEGITSVADNQFANYSKLEKAVLNDNITSIGNNAFYRCSNLNELKMPEKLETIGNNAFAYCPLLPEIIIPEKVASVGDNAFSGCTSAETVTFEGAAVKALGSYAFGGCSSITSITVPDGVTHIGSDLFYQCESLREINLPDSIISIKSGLIRYTPYDEDYDYYEDMLYIGNHLIEAGYYDMPAKYIVRKGTKSIAQYAFSNQHSLETVVIHKGLVSMDDDIFNDCPSLTKICFTGTEAEWNAILKGNNDFSAYDIEFNYYVCPHENTENKEAVAPGCYTYGYTEGIYCNDCGEWLKGHRQLEMSHEDSNGDTVCDNCQAVVSDISVDVYKTVGSGDFEDDLTFVAPATGEYTIVSFSEGVIDPYVDLTDSEYVSIDGNDEQDDDYNNDNYDFSLTCTLEKGKTYHFIITTWCEGDFQVLLTFDCEHTGGTATCRERAECSACGMQYGSLNMNNHTALTVIPAEAANCGKAGKTAGEKCTACGTVTVAQTLVPATGNHTGGTATCKSKAVCTVCEKEYGSLNANSHKNITTLKAVAATCTRTGKTEGKKCSDCSKVTVAQNTVPAKGHKLTTLKAVAATCTKAGKTEGKKCSVCGTVTVAQKTVAKKAHTFKTTTTKATLKKNGKQVTKCTVCSYVKSTKTIYYPKTIKLSATSYTYNGKAKTPTVTVKDSKGNTLKKDTDYTVKYASGRKNPGKYTVTVTFKGKYEGTKKLTFTIKPAKAALSKVTAGSKQATVAWKTVTGATGYEVQYSTSSK